MCDEKARQKVPGNGFKAPLALFISNGKVCHPLLIFNRLVQTEKLLSVCIKTEQWSPKKGRVDRKL